MNDDELLKNFFVTVSSMTATYSGLVKGTSALDAMNRLREKYRHNNDNRYNWSMTARKWQQGDDELCG